MASQAKERVASAPNLASGGASKGAIHGIFLFVSLYSFPLFFRVRIPIVEVLSIGSACFTLGGRRGSHGRRAGEVWTGLKRWRDRGELGVTRTTVACTSLTTEQQRDAMSIFVPYVVAASFTRGLTSHDDVCPRCINFGLGSIEHPIVYYICGQSGHLGIDVRSSNTTTVECQNERHRSPFASRSGHLGIDVWSSNTTAVECQNERHR